MYISKVDNLPNIDRCLEPKRIINPYTHEVVYAPCRKCAACLNAKGSHWSYRVQQECKYHRYSLFGTLTYDNDHIPYYYVDKDFNAYTSSFEVDKGVYNVLENVEPYSADIRLNHDIYNRKFIIPTFNIKDVQKFFKRLRSKIAYFFKIKNIKNESQKIRYYLCAEYGGKTLRPHYHFILWYDSPTIMANILQFLTESWQNGSVRRVELVNSAAPQYVAKYVAGNSNLPKVLCLKFTRPFHVQSKSPCIGYGKDDEAALLENVFNGTYGRYQYDVASQSTLYVQPARSLEMRFLPKCREYRSLSYIEKLRVYSYSFENSGGDLKKRFDSEVDRYCSRQCNRFCHQHNITPRQYVKLLDRYYKNKDYYLLKEQLYYQKIYLEYLHLPKVHLLGMYPTFYEDLPHHLKDYPGSPVYYICESYGLKLDDVKELFYTRYKLDGFKVEKTKQKYSQFGVNNRMLQYKYLYDANKTKIYNDTFNPEYLE